MQRQHYSTTSQHARRAIFDIIGAVILISAGVILMLAYFDVLVK